MEISVSRLWQFAIGGMACKNDREIEITQHFHFPRFSCSCVHAFFETGTILT